MRKTFQFMIPVAVLGTAFLLNTAVSFAKKEYTAKEKKACNYCHTVAAPKDGKELTEAGKYYAAHDHSLEGFAAKDKK